MARIVRVEVGRFEYPLVGDFKFFKAGMRPSIVVRLTDDNGVQGWGQSVPIETWTYETVESVETTLGRFTRLIEPLMLVIMAVVIALILLALYMPVFQLSSAVS